MPLQNDFSMYSIPFCDDSGMASFTISPHWRQSLFDTNQRISSFFATNPLSHRHIFLRRQSHIFWPFLLLIAYPIRRAISALLPCYLLTISIMRLLFFAACHTNHTSSAFCCLLTMNQFIFYRQQHARCH